MNISTPIWSAQQDQALQAVKRWYESGDSLFYLAGYAGTGKTTLAQAFAADTGGRVLFAAFTGKAASVMKAKGCAGASTIHSLIYRPLFQYHCRAHPEFISDEVDHCPKCGNAMVQKGQPEYVLNEQSALHSADLLIVDECSMVDARLGHDVMSFGVPVLTIGDPAQLPPVQGDGFFTSGAPDMVLTEIHRQAADNPIIAMATRVREGHRLKFGTYGDSVVKRAREVEQSDFDRSDIRLAGKNATTFHLNGMWRKFHGRDADPLPVDGERILCLRNNVGKGLLNGTLWDVNTVVRKTKDSVHMKITPEGGGLPSEVLAPAKFFAPPVAGEEQWPTDESFRFGYALTVHKSQGSEWDDVLLFDEHGTFRENAQKWLYTGLTRAAKRITVLIP